MRIRSLIIGLLTVVPVTAMAQDAPSYRCANGDLERRVVVMYETGVTVPCEVHYYKDTEAPGTSQVLWRALNEEGFCEARAADFVTKLEGWGWSCDAGPVDDDPGPRTERGVRAFQDVYNRRVAGKGKANRVVRGVLVRVLQPGRGGVPNGLQNWNGVLGREPGKVLQVC